MLTMCNRNMFRQTDFDAVEGGALHLRPEASRRFFAEYERRMLHAPLGNSNSGFCSALRKTVEAYAVAVRDTHAFTPFL